MVSKLTVVEIAERVAEFKKQKNWSDAEFARRVGVHASAVPKYLKGDFNPLKLLPVLRNEGADVWYILTGEYSQKLHIEEREMLNLLRLSGYGTLRDVRELVRKAKKLDRLTDPGEGDAFWGMVDRLAREAKEHLTRVLENESNET